MCSLFLLKYLFFKYLPLCCSSDTIHENVHVCLHIEFACLFQRYTLQRDLVKPFYNSIERQMNVSNMVYDKWPFLKKIQVNRSVSFKSNVRILLFWKIALLDKEIYITQVIDVAITKDKLQFRNSSFNIRLHLFFICVLCFFFGQLSFSVFIACIKK